MQGKVDLKDQQGKERMAATLAQATLVLSLARAVPVSPAPLPWWRHPRPRQRWAQGGTYHLVTPAKTGAAATLEGTSDPGGTSTTKRAPVTSLAAAVEGRKY